MFLLEIEVPIIDCSLWYWVTSYNMNCVKGGNFNSDEAVSTTIRLKAFISKAFYGLLNSLKTAAIEVVKLISKALVYLLTRSSFCFQDSQNQETFFLCFLQSALYDSNAQ
uniref:Uncharacterized protein n=1 Tax=Quercus lobata TaxID=97700 RepID=A0A7N2RBS8_QUELO